MGDQKQIEITGLQATSLYKMLSGEEKQIVNTLAIKKVIYGTVSIHDVTMAFISRKGINKEVAEQDEELGVFLSKFETISKA